MKEYIVTEHPDFPYEEPKPKELIRCKDCAEWKVRRGGIKRNYCGKTGCIVEKDDFCSKAEPKDKP